MEHDNAADSLLVQRELHQLLMNPTPDRRSFAKILQGLGGAECTPAAPLACFLTALLETVWEND